MKRIAILALAAAVSTPALAASDTNSTNFSGERQVECTLDNMDQVVDFGQLGRRGQAGVQVDNGIDVFCNQPFSVKFESTNGYLKLVGASANQAAAESTPNFESTANPGFGAGVDYTASIPAFSVSADSTQLSAATPVTLAPVPAQNLNNVAIRYDTIANTLPLLGGQYRDTLIVTLTTLGV